MLPDYTTAENFADECFSLATTKDTENFSEYSHSNITATLYTNFLCEVLETQLSHLADDSPQD
jgi:hypothetical protein